MTTIELGPALSVAIRVDMSIASAHPSLNLSPSFFLAPNRTVAILTLSGGATAAATKRVWEAGTLGFTSPGNVT